MNGKTVISIFSGCGGSTLGYKLAGFKELLAIDCDNNSVETFKANFPETPIWKRDIRNVKSQEILNFCNIKVGELDVLDGSPPCQGFSTAGKRQVNDNRNDLFDEMIRLIKELQPKVFVIENVPGMIKGKMKGRFKNILRNLKALNYSIKIKLMNAKYYSVPQSRERIIFLGVRKDLEKEPIFPKPNLKTISVKDALGRNGYIKYRSRYYKGFVNFGTAYFDCPCPTITKTRSWQVYPENFTISDLKKLSSFPEEFNFVGSFNQQWARIGNAVMPKFMEAIAKNIIETILNGKGKK